MDKSNFLAPYEKETMTFQQSLQYYNTLDRFGIGRELQFLNDEEQSEVKLKALKKVTIDYNTLMEDDRARLRDIWLRYITYTFGAIGVIKVLTSKTFIKYTGIRITRNRVGRTIAAYKGFLLLFPLGLLCTTELLECGLRFGLKYRFIEQSLGQSKNCLLYTSPSPRDGLLSRMPSSA
eukprot:TRINITY_DN13063_c0_g1_i1.p1 TRINITY_DN13063_c0_g1~~TRINITY_DN13063_c0_g1_i1.p1  ORF type:complete len:178 (+),score=13.19 TRINITY_DN13063_c0_g1_i1:172-705(+)